MNKYDFSKNWVGKCPPCPHSSRAPVHGSKFTGCYALNFKWDWMWCFCKMEVHAKRAISSKLYNQIRGVARNLKWVVQNFTTHKELGIKLLKYWYYIRVSQNRVVQLHHSYPSNDTPVTLYFFQTVYVSKLGGISLIRTCLSTILPVLSVSEEILLIYNTVSWVCL